jgi:CheY-like chemotaxis protein
MEVRGARLLVLEDDPLIAIDAEDMLLGLGARAVHLASSVAAAAALVAGSEVDLAMLDLRIGSGRSDNFAEELLVCAVPFIFTSGYGSDSGLPERLSGVPRVGKPYTAEALHAAFSALPDRTG